MTYELDGWHDLRPAMSRALDAGVGGVAVLKPNGDPIVIGGWLQRAEARLFAYEARKLAPQGILDRMFCGELATATEGSRIASGGRGTLFARWHVR